MVKITQLVKFSISLVLIFSVAFFTSAQSESDIMTASVSYEDSLSEATAGQPSPKIIKLSNYQYITD